MKTVPFLFIDFRSEINKELRLMGIKRTLQRCVNNSYNRSDVNNLISHCFNVAVTSLRIKSGSFKSFMIREENLEDLAWDFIADLFQKNDKGELIVIKEFFECRPIDSMKESKLSIELRRLVCSKVEDNVFRFYGEKDPSLKKIIRNIKLAIKEHNCKHSMCYRNGDLVVDDEINNLVRMPSELMQIKLCSRLTESLMIPDILIEVIDILEHQNQYKKCIALVTLASIIRESFVIIQDSEIDNTDPDVYSMMLQNEVDRFLGKSVDKIKDNISQHYIEKEKSEHHEIEIYFQTAKEIVKSTFEGTSGNKSQFEQLKKHYQQLEYDQFRNEHRSILEYIVKMVREDMLNTFKKDWSHFQQR